MFFFKRNTKWIRKCYIRTNSGGSTIGPSRQLPTVCIIHLSSLDSSELASAWGRLFSTTVQRLTLRERGENAFIAIVQTPRGYF